MLNKIPLKTVTMLLFAITVNIVKATANLEKFDTLFL